MAQESEPPFNPADDKLPDEEQAFASLWELLRRNTEFQVIAKKWIASESFRKDHALAPEYCDFRRLVPRCALDWMLTPKQRLELAQFQIEKRTWQFGRHRNFGPITWHWRDPLARMSRKTAYDSIEVRPMKNAPAPITFNTAWNAVPEPFKRQFRFAAQPRKPAFASINQTIGDTSPKARPLCVRH
jgi:hypothetical protein